MRGRVFLLFLVCVASLVTACAVQAEIMEFTPSRDNTLYEDIEGSLSNGSGDQVFFGRTGPNADSVVRRALLHFDVSAIPQDAVIDSVELSIEIDMVPKMANGGTAFLHRVLADWGEGGSNAFPPEGAGAPAQSMDATWKHRKYDTELWNVLGGDFQDEPSASAGYGFALETITFTTTPALIRDLNKWVSQPDENFGWIVIGNEGTDHTARRFDSRENDDVGASPALLTVGYHIEGPTDNLGLELVTSGFDRPVVITNAGDGSDRLFIVEQRGVIHIYDLATEALLPAPFLDISTLVEDAGGEEGLLGLVFHPDYENNRQFYVNYTYPPGPGEDLTRIAMYQASTGDPDIADTTETVIMEFEQNASNHNGGDMHFDPDGYLVIASGDGGGSPGSRPQDMGLLVGKMLRIDVDTVNGDEKCGTVANYGIPPDNPFTGPADGCDEILHLGLRNPWRFSIDARTGEMFIGDVGQNLWEEVDYAMPGETGINFGWPDCEGGHENGSPTELCEVPAYRNPIIEYSSDDGTGNCSVTGGYVYRGGNSLLQGRYVYADFCSARFWIATREGDNWVSVEWKESPPLNRITTFGQDENCELYVADFTGGNIYRIVNSEYLDASGFERLQCQ